MLSAILFLVIWVGVWLALVMSSVFTTSNGIFASGFLAFIVATVVTAIATWLFKGIIWVLIIIAAIILIILLVKKIKGGGSSGGDNGEDSSS